MLIYFILKTAIICILIKYFIVKITLHFTNENQNNQIPLEEPQRVVTLLTGPLFVKIDSQTGRHWHIWCSIQFPRNIKTAAKIHFICLLSEAEERRLTGLQGGRGCKIKHNTYWHKFGFEITCTFSFHEYTGRLINLSFANVFLT
jgi:hypothetical protein